MMCMNSEVDLEGGHLTTTRDVTTGKQSSLNL